MEGNSDEQDVAAGATATDFSVLPEGCIANSLSLMSPREACRLSLVASIFRSAAASDAVWERFLPSDYQDIIARSGGGCDSTASAASLAFDSKKKLYLHLCDHPIVIDGGTKSFSLEKSGGKKCYMLAAEDLFIVWSDTPRYWRWTSLPESRFSKVAELISVCWLEIRGKISTCMLSPNTLYAAYLVFKTASGGGTHGFEYQPVEASVGTIGSEVEILTVYLDPEGVQRQRFRGRRIGLRQAETAVRGRSPWTIHMLRQDEPPVSSSESSGQYPKQRDDGWMEIELGSYFSEGGGRQDGEELEMRLMEVKGGNWKGGLIVMGIDIRPKAVSE